MQHNLEKEKRLIDLLGYDLVGPDNSNRWRIFDKNMEVGYIQYKKLYGGNLKKGYPKNFGYNTFIDSSTIAFESPRTLNNNSFYKFDLKRNNHKIAHVEMNIGNFPSLILYSEKYGSISFKVDFQGLY